MGLHRANLLGYLYATETIYDEAIMGAGGAGGATGPGMLDKEGNVRSGWQSARTREENADPQSIGAALSGLSRTKTAAQGRANNVGTSRDGVSPDGYAVSVGSAADRATTGTRSTGYGNPANQANVATSSSNAGQAPSKKSRSRARGGFSMADTQKGLVALGGGNGGPSSTGKKRRLGA